MHSVLLVSTPIHGHVTPLLAVARQLVADGHRVRFLTGERYREKVEATGAEYLALPEGADYADTDFDRDFPGRVGLTGPKAITHDMREIFLKPMPLQSAAIDAALAAEPTDVVLAESLFFGVLPLLTRPRHERPAVLNLGIVPLGIASRDTAPFGLGIPPMPGALGRIRNALLTFLATNVIFGAVRREADRMVRELTGRRPTTPFLNWVATSDGVIQFTVAGFEYPRTDLPVPVHFVGPVSRSAPATGELPIWWSELDGSRPVVHVTQGTVANANWGELVLPTVRGLADDDVLVVVSTGGRDVATLGELPANVRAAEYLPYDELLPRTDVLVSNGGYGGVHFALAHGVPLVVAGATEDKAEVTARVAWSGAGINLRTNEPAAEQIAEAVRTVLADDGFAIASRRLGAEIAAAPGVAGVSAVLDQAAAQRGASRAS